MEKSIYLAAGCFWGAQHYLKQIKGICDTQAGFANGDETLLRKDGDNVEGPSYEQVYTDTTGFAETVRVAYDNEILPLRRLLELYFLSINPTAVNEQGEDIGTRYRTGIYYIDSSDLPTIMEVCREVQHGYSQPLAVEVEPLRCFFAAEDFHQDYLDKHPEGYCHIPQALFEVARQSHNR